MIKHRKKVIITIIFTIQLSPIYAGDFFIGMRTWQADWAPGIIKKKEDDASRHTLYAFLQGNNELRKVPYATKSVSGFYGGPLVSYVTDNRKLSFSLGYFIARGNSIESSISFESNGLTGNEKFERFNLEAMNTTMTLRGLTAEITYTSVITKTYYLQVGYRGQVSEIDMNGTMDNYSFGYVTARGSTKNIFRPIPYPGNKFMDRFSGFSVSLLYKI